ncbi:MAG: hypothetical protein D6816_00830 [Bacteroidetes bacterium]|nr:MAG: hypothetical protein D6816_00830 [Bacteroidota bacterium]
MVFKSTHCGDISFHVRDLRKALFINFGPPAAPGESTISSHSEGLNRLAIATADEKDFSNFDPVDCNLNRSLHRIGMHARPKYLTFATHLDTITDKNHYNEES